MRTLIVGLVVVAAACGKGNKEHQEAVKAALVIPKIEVATVLAKETSRMPWLLVVDDKGVRIGAAESWAALDVGDLKLTKKSHELRDIDGYIREDFAMGKLPSDTVAALDERGDSEGVEIDLSSLEDTTHRNGIDDPPPPEEEDKPDDGAEESGGTGTAMALEEGKMGKKDSDRAEGQYKMQKNQEDPQLARQQAIEQARNAGILSRVDGTGRDSDKGVGFGPGRQDGMPSRLSQVEGAVLEDGRLDVLRALILIAPTAKATKLIETVRDTQGSIAVMHGGKVRPLRLSFMYQGGLSASKGWVEARVSKTGITVEAVPDKSIDVADLKGLAAALDKARKERGTDADAPVDVLVDADVDVQRMVDVLVALDTAGVRLIGLGLAPTVEQLSKRGHRIPAVAMGQPNAQGDLDKAIIRRYVRKSQPQIAECYEKALAVNPDLEGTVQTQFFITPNGNVASSTASGVDPAVANCIGEVIKKIEFPKPQGGGGVQVNYPFTLRP